MELKTIAHIRTDFPEKFGIPRQSNLVNSLIGKIVFEEEYKNADALRGLEEYDYLWIIWKFDVDASVNFRPTVRPPKLGGNERVGVFATRSPFRPNPVALSSVKIEEIEISSKDGPVIWISGIDMRDNSEIYDIKPYLPYVDSHENARGGFSDYVNKEPLIVEFPENELEKIEKSKQIAAIEMLKQDIRPSYHEDLRKKYGVTFANVNINFTICKNKVTVLSVDKL